MESTLWCKILTNQCWEILTCKKLTNAMGNVRHLDRHAKGSIFSVRTENICTIYGHAYYAHSASLIYVSIAS